MWGGIDGTPDPGGLRRAGRSVALALAVAAGGTGALPAAPVSAQTDGFCFPGRPHPECRVAGLVEAAVVYRLAGESPVVNQDPWEATWEVGALVNRESGEAWGGTFLIGTGEYRPRLALKLRHRRWLGDDWTADVGLGPMTHSTSVDDWGVGGMVDLGLGYRDQAGAFARVEVLPKEGGGATTAGFLGARLGSWPAIAGSGLAGLVFLIAILNADFE